MISMAIQTCPGVISRDYEDFRGFGAILLLISISLSQEPIRYLHALVGPVIRAGISSLGSREIYEIESFV